MKIEKVDAHHHLWTLASPNYPMLTAPSVERYIGNTGRLKHDFGAREFLPLAASQNVTRSVYVESHFAPPIEETAHVQAFADAHCFPNAIIGRVDLASPGLSADLDIHMRSSLFRGIRTIVMWDEDPQFQSAPAGLLSLPAWKNGYAELGARGLIAEIMALPSQLAQLASLSAELSGTRLVVGHTGMPLRRTSMEDAVWRDSMAQLASLPHVYAKISGLGMCDHAWTVDSIRPLVRHVIDVFTPERCMFASNFPVDGLYATYDEVWDAFDRITADLGQTARDALFRKTASRLYGLA